MQLTYRSPLSLSLSLSHRRDRFAIEVSFLTLIALMAYEQQIHRSISQFESDGYVSLKQKSKSISSQATDSETANGCFECNICLDSAHEPVVTLCGHLYCWPCIYKWLHVQSSSFDSEEQPKCPVCKANISQSSLVPLYGRGPTKSDPKGYHPDPVIPRRPTPHGVHTLLTSRPNQQLRPLHRQQIFPAPHGNYTSIAPTMGMVGEMVLARMFGNSDTRSFPYPYSNAYPVTGNGIPSPRMRRQEMEVDKSLNRVTIFLFCCFVLCLLLF